MIYLTANSMCVIMLENWVCNPGTLIEGISPNYTHPDFLASIEQTSYIKLTQMALYIYSELKFTLWNMFQVQNLPHWRILARHAIPRPGPCITNVFAIRRKNFSQWHRSFQRKLLSHWLKFLRHVAITLVIQGPALDMLLWLRNHGMSLWRNLIWIRTTVTSYNGQIMREHWVKT